MITEQIKGKLLVARKATDKIAINILSTALGEIQKQESTKEISEETKINIIRKIIQANNEVIAYKPEDSKVEILNKENLILESLLPIFGSEDQIRELLSNCELDRSNFGKAMGTAIKYLKENAKFAIDNSIVKKVVEELTFVC